MDQRLSTVRIFWNVLLLRRRSNTEIHLTSLAAASGAGSRKFLATDAAGPGVTINVMKPDVVESSCEETYGIFPCSSSLAGGVNGIFTHLCTPYHP
jgi:hypothetical protein